MASKRQRRARARQLRAHAPEPWRAGVELPASLPELMDIAQAAAALGVSAAALRQRERAGLISFERGPDGVWVRRRELARHAREYSPRRGGRPPVVPPELLARIGSLRATGMSLPAIAAQLTGEGVPPTRGGRRWWPSSVAWALGRHTAAG